MWFHLDNLDNAYKRIVVQAVDNAHRGKKGVSMLSTALRKSGHPLDNARGGLLLWWGGALVQERLG